MRLRYRSAAPEPIINRYPWPPVIPQVLDAPALQDDFYLNLVDWSAQNVLAVGLGSCVYLWSACTSKVGSQECLHARCDEA